MYDKDMEFIPPDNDPQALVDQFTDVAVADEVKGKRMPHCTRLLKYDVATGHRLILNTKLYIALEVLRKNATHKQCP